jgi:hypothetical protein
MSIEVPSHVQEILGPYPELVEQWKAEMARPEMQQPGWEGTVEMYLDPLYLRRVAFEHRRLITGDIERPGPELAAAIEAALQLHDRMRREREAALSDPWWRAMSCDYNGIAQFHDPELLRRRGECYRKLDDPLSKESIRLRRFVEEFSGGGTFEVTDDATGEEVNTITIEGTRPGAAPRN